MEKTPTCHIFMFLLQPCYQQAKAEIKGGTKHGPSDAKDYIATKLWPTKS
jgi:hypothetical protein